MIVRLAQSQRLSLDMPLWPSLCWKWLNMAVCSATCRARRAWRCRPTRDERLMWRRSHTLPRRLLNVSKTTDGAALSQRSDMVVFLNGEYIPADQARVGIATHALSYGNGCFEGIRAYYNSDTEQLYIFRALEHFQRLAR